uniref:sel1-repeat-containing protein YbeT-like isoform X1 n=1 Tax=Pristiophorus japonicus TaxID=55135 RepID=UPI00398E80AB
MHLRKVGSKGITASGGPGSRPRKEQGDQSGWSLCEGVTAVLALSFLLYLFLYYQTFHLHVTHAYAHLGYPAAQHSIGQRYLHGLGVEKDEEVAMRWFRKAADQGHPHASYNLAVGKLKAMTSDVEDWEVEELLSRAAVHGLKEAQDALENLHRNSDN